MTFSRVFQFILVVCVFLLTVSSSVMAATPIGTIKVYGSSSCDGDVSVAHQVNTQFVDNGNTSRVPGYQSPCFNLTRLGNITYYAILGCSYDDKIYPMSWMQTFNSSVCDDPSAHVLVFSGGYNNSDSICAETTRPAMPIGVTLVCTLTNSGHTAAVSLPFVSLATIFVLIVTTLLQ